MAAAQFLITATKRTMALQQLPLTPPSLTNNRPRFTPSFEPPDKAATRWHCPDADRDVVEGFSMKA
jgi:hypothetical protein